MNLQPIVVDDDDIICFLVKKLLKLSNYPEPKSFLSAIDALDFIKKHETTQTRYAIFLDINMPVMNGWEFIETLESLSVISNYEIFILTSSINQNDKDKAFTYSSVKKFIEKPLRKNDLELLKENEYLKPFF